MGNPVAYLQKSNRSGKKYMVTVVKSDGKKCTVHFGAAGMSDYTKHKDSDRMERYNQRHKSRENWGKSGICKAGFWAKWILWSKPSLGGAIAYTSRKFGITIKNAAPPRGGSPKSKSKSKRKSRRSRR